ncbi:MAG: phosphodiester glycosidase family protein [Sphingomonadaceae bacterium]
MRKATVCCILGMAMGLTACGQEQPGKPVARAQIGKATATGQPSVPAPTDSASATPSFASEVETSCRSVIYRDVPLTQCLAIPANNKITTALAASSNAPYRSLTAYAKAHDASKIAFAMNGGWYDEKGQPTGYFVQDSKRLQPLVSDAKANSGGVFYGTGDDWEIRTTKDFLANVTKRPDFGIQSGPMLVTDGRIDAAARSKNTKAEIRSAVGIDDKGRAHFVISNAPVSTELLARFFASELKVKNALCLDKGTSQLWSPATDRLDTGDPIGPILVIEKRPETPN